MNARSVVDLVSGRSGLVVLAVSLGIVAAARCDVAAAQAAPANTATANVSIIPEVVITGTSIKGINAETALPVQVLTSADIARTGVTTAEQLFQQISAASSSGLTNAAHATGFQTGSISTISLRGLGSARTLVLINGRRSAPYGGGSTGPAGDSVDISSIPISMVERVEILKDGASAIYGSDAIAGVVNFILKKDYQGAQITAYAGTPTRSGGGSEENLSGSVGHGDLNSDRYNVALGFNFDHMSPIMGASRAFAQRYSPGYGNDVTSSFAFPANVAIPVVGTRNPNTPDCGPDSLFDTNFPKQCRFDNSKFDSLQPEQQKLNFYLTATRALSGNNQLYGEASYAQTKTTTFVQPVPLSYQNPLLPGNPYIAYLANLLATQYPTYNNPAVKPGEGAFLLPPTSPYYPAAFAAANGQAGQPLNLIYRDFANGDRETLDTADTYRVVAGIKGNVAGWDYDGAALYSEIKVHEDLESGYALYSKIMPLLDTGTINPFGPTSDPSALAAAKATEFVGQDFASKTSLTSLAGTASREIMPLPAGKLSVAVGAELRHETFEYDPATAIQTGDVTGEGGNQLPENASRNVESAFAEVYGDLLTGLSADAAVRYDNYQNIGSTVNPKGSLRWQPVQWILFRGSAGSGFRAPSLTDLYAAQATSVTSNGTRDPIKCPVFNPNNPACSFQFSTVTGGNPGLQPEKSHTFTFGTAIQPTPDLRIDLDSFWIFLRNEIVVGGLNYANILQNAQTAEEFAGLITRDANGNIISISQTNANLFKTDLSGLDMDVRYGFDVGHAGRISLLGNGTYFFKYVTQNFDGSYTSQLDQGLDTIGGVVSRFRYNLTALYAVSDWEVSLTQHYQKRYTDALSSITQVPRFVSAYDTADAQVSYTGLKSFRFTLGANNVFDKDPPYANYAASANNFVGGYDLAYGDPRGRFVYASIGYTLH
jgi:iron complex outermembrane receptor protein